MLLVQEFLKTHSFKELQEQHGVYASFSKSGHKFSLNYDQLEAKEADPLAQECRGLILGYMPPNPCGMIPPEPVPWEIDANGKVNRDNIIPGNTKVLAYPMNRFFNYGQGAAANIDWADPNLAILEKLDGTLCIVYFDRFTDKWCVATRSVPEADLLMDNGIFTFRTLFEKALMDTTGLSFEEYSSKLDKEITYCFELTTPYNRIVVNYTNNRITLLAARAVIYATNGTGKEWESFQELDLNEVPTFGVPIVQAYTYTSITELLNWVSSLNPMEHEGIVVRDSNFNRIKVKNAAYVAYNRVRDTLGASERNCVEIILQEKDDDVIPMLPEEIVKNLLKIKSGLQESIKFYDDLYSEIKNAADAQYLGDKKTFALLLQSKAISLNKEKSKSLWQAPFFQIFDGKAISMKDFIIKNKKDGTWSDSFLDKLLELSKNSKI